MKILVVDDEALLVKGIRFNLQSEGYEVITGSDGIEAVTKVQEQNPDLVVLDVMMPNMDGMAACAKIREFSNVPIILLTAKTGPCCAGPARQKKKSRATILPSAPSPWIWTPGTLTAPVPWQT